MSRASDKRARRERKLSAKRRTRVEREAEQVFAAAQRNEGMPRGRQVSTGDVAAYALAGHVKCGGRGLLGTEMACPCATRRFLKRHPEVIITVEGGVCRVYWPLKVAIQTSEEGA